MIAFPVDDPGIWCGIPVYNNAATIFDIAKRAREQITRVLVIDDGSTDADLRQLLAPLDVRVIRHEKNFGKGAALRTAFQHACDAGAKYLITLDGDGQHFPEDISRFVPRLSPDELLIGYRDEITGEMPESSQFGRDFSDFWIYLETGQTVNDTQSGFRAYPLQAVMQLRLESLHYNFEMEIITKSVWAGLRAGTLPIRVWYPSADDRVSSFHPFRDNLRISLLHTRLVLRQLLPIPHQQIQAGSELRRRVGSIVEKSSSSKISSDFLFSRQEFLPQRRRDAEKKYKRVIHECKRMNTNRNGNQKRVHSLSALFSDSCSFVCIRGSISSLPLRVSALKKRCWPQRSRTEAYLRTGLDFAITTWISIVMGIVLWPWGFIPVAYVVIRLHLTKWMALLWLLLVLPPVVPAWCGRLGHAMVHGNVHLEWVVGAHTIALPLASAAAWLVFKMSPRKLSA